MFMKSGSRMIIDNSLVGSSKSNGIPERALQSAQGLIRTIRSAIKEKWLVKIDVIYAVWPWIAEQTGFLLTRFEVGRDGKTAYERLKGKSAKVQGLSLAEGPLGKLTCLREDGVYLGIMATTGEVIVGSPTGVWLTRMVQRKMARERCERSNLEMVVAVPSRKNEDDAKMGGDRLSGEVVMMEKDY